MSAPKPPAPPKPPRSPVERAIVWGVIGLGLLVIGVEANAHLSHTAALGKLQAQLDATLSKDSGLTKKGVDQVVGNKTPETQKLGFLDTAMAAARVDIYTYPGLLRSRKLYVYYGIDGKLAGQEAEVMEVLTSVAPTASEAQAKLPPIDPNAKYAGPGEGVAGAGGPDGPGSGTGGGTGGGRGKHRGNAKADAGGRPAAEDSAEPAAETKPAAEAKPADPVSEEKKSEDAKPAAETKPEEAKPAAPEAKQE